MGEKELRQRKESLEAELAEVDTKLAHIELMKKPYEAVVYHWCVNRSSTFWKTEDVARSKFEEYRHKTYFKNGRVDRVQLLKHNEDGSVNVIEDIKK